MIPILYEASETMFASNGIGRLNDVASVEVVEERNGQFECNFEMPINGAHFDDIICGRIIYVTHDDSKIPQPFDIVSYSKPIDGKVKFHAVHVSYRQSGIVAKAQNINSLSAAMAAMKETAQPDNPFTYKHDFDSNAYMAAFDGIPRSVRQLLGGIEGSVLDAYGGEYEWDGFTVFLHRERGINRSFTIRYGVNMTDYNDDTDYSGTYTSCVPYWKGNDNGAEKIVFGNLTESGNASYNGRTVAAALDLSDKFETAPTVAQLTQAAKNYMVANQTNLPHQTIKVDFVRLQDLGYEGLENLLQCNLCDRINVEFPRYGMRGQFKIVKTVWDALEDRYKSMELGALSVSLADALGITTSADSLRESSTVDFVVDELNTSEPNVWNYRKWDSGTLECWARFYTNSMNVSGTTGSLRFAAFSISNRNYPVAFVGNYPTVTVSGNVTNGNGWAVMNNTNYSLTQMGGVYVYAPTALTGVGVTVNVYAIGRWK